MWLTSLVKFDPACLLAAFSGIYTESVGVVDFGPGCHNSLKHLTCPARTTYMLPSFVLKVFSYCRKQLTTVTCRSLTEMTKNAVVTHTKNFFGREFTEKLLSCPPLRKLFKYKFISVSSPNSLHITAKILCEVL